MNFDVSITSGSFEFESFAIGISAKNNSPNLTFSLKSSNGLDVSTSVNENDVSNGASTQVAILTLAGGPYTLSNGSYSLVFSAPTANDNDWAIEPANGFQWNAGFTQPLTTGDLGSEETNITISNYQDGDLTPIPESDDYLTLSGLSLLLISIYLRRNKSNKRSKWS